MKRWHFKDCVKILCHNNKQYEYKLVCVKSTPFPFPKATAPKRKKEKSKRKNKAIAKLIWTSDDYHAPMSREIHGYSSLHCSPTTRASGPFFAFHHSK